MERAEEKSSVRTDTGVSVQFQKARTAMTGSRYFSTLFISEGKYRYFYGTINTNEVLSIFRCRIPEEDSATLIHNP